MDDKILAAQKASLRKSMKTVRRAAFEKAFAGGGNPEDALWQSGFADLAAKFPPESLIGCYAPIQSEFPTYGLMRRLQEAGHKLCLPLVTGKALPLAFLSWAVGEPLCEGTFGAKTPDPETAQTVTPGVLLVPLLAFDGAGYRLGYGGGFYDRSIARYRPHTTVGIAFAQQRTDRVPKGVYDRALTRIATEAGVVTCTPRNGLSEKI